MISLTFIGDSRNGTMVNGEPVVGKLAEDPVGLEVLPLTLTTWGEWRWRHPTTTVLDLEPLAFYYPFDYQPGAADEARTGVSFPVWKKSNRLERNTEVYVLRFGGHAKAFVVEAALAAEVVNEVVGDLPVVLVADSRSGSIRAYERGERSFRWNDEDQLEDDRERAWSLTEEALTTTNDDGETEILKRLPGHVAFWFGWYGFNAGSTLGMGEPDVVARVAMNTTLAPSAGAIVAMIFAWVRYGKPDLTIALNGVLAGLVTQTHMVGFIGGGVTPVVRRLDYPHTQLMEGAQAFDLIFK